MVTARTAACGRGTGGGLGLAPSPLPAPAGAPTQDPGKRPAAVSPVRCRASRAGAGPESKGSGPHTAWGLGIGSPLGPALGGSESMPPPLRLMGAGTLAGSLVASSLT